LQKEITSLRDTTRNLQLKLRDTEVANDDYERQARHTTSSLEDLESKHNMAIEKAVVLEEEIRVGEQEREGLRIETQRLRDEMSDVRVELDITTDKLRKAELALQARHIERLKSQIDLERPTSSISQLSALTPPSPNGPTDVKSETTATSEVSTPPSLVPSNAQNDSISQRSNKSLNEDDNFNSSGATFIPPLYIRGSSLSNGRMGPPIKKSSISQPIPATEGLARSKSLYQIKNIIGRMQKIEERVHSARSKLTPITGVSTESSPRSKPTPGIPLSVTIRTPRKRQSIIGTTTSDMNGFSFSNGGLNNDIRPSSRASNTSASDSNPFLRPSSRLSTAGGTSRSTIRSRQSIGPQPTLIRKDINVDKGEDQDLDRTVLEPPSTPTNRRTTIDRSAIPTPSTGRRTSVGINVIGGTGRRQSNIGSISPIKPQNSARRKVSNALGETY